jgi:hypothetical protein
MPTINMTFRELFNETTCSREAYVKKYLCMKADNLDQIMKMKMDNDADPIPLNSLEPISLTKEINGRIYGPRTLWTGKQYKVFGSREISCELKVDNIKKITAAGDDVDRVWEVTVTWNHENFEGDDSDEEKLTGGVSISYGMEMRRRNVLPILARGYNHSMPSTIQSQVDKNYTDIGMSVNVTFNDEVKDVKGYEIAYPYAKLAFDYEYIGTTSQWLTKSMNFLALIGKINAQSYTILGYTFPQQTLMFDGISSSIPVNMKTQALPHRIKVSSSVNFTYKPYFDINDAAGQGTFTMSKISNAGPSGKVCGFNKEWIFQMLSDEPSAQLVFLNQTNIEGDFNILNFPNAST